MAEQVLKIVIENEEAVSALKETQTANKEFTDAFVKSSDERSAKLKQLQSDLAAIAEAQKSASATANQKSGYEFASVAIKKQIADLEKLSGAQKKSAAASKVQEGAIRQVGEATESIRTKMLKLQRTLGDMALAGKENTTEYKEMSKALGEMQGAYKGVQQQAAFFRDHARWLNATTQAVQGLIGAYSIYAGVASMVAGEDEDLQKQMMKMQRLMTIMIGLTQVANTLNKDSMVTTARKVIQEKLLGFYLNITGKQTAAATAATAANTSATAANTTATNAGTKAQIAFNMAKLGVWGIVIGLIAGATWAIIKYTENIKRATEESDKLKSSLAGIDENMNKRIEIIGESKRSVEDYIKSVEDSGKTEEEKIRDIAKLGENAADEFVKYIDKKIDARQQEIDDLNGLIKKEKEYQEGLKNTNMSSQSVAAAMQQSERNINHHTLAIDRENRAIQWHNIYKGKTVSLIDEEAKKLKGKLEQAIKDDAAEKARQKAMEERNKALEAYLRLLEKLKKDAESAELEGLTGIDRIEAEGKRQIKAIQEFADDLLTEKRKAHGKEAELSEKELAWIGLIELTARKKTHADIHKWMQEQADKDRDKLNKDTQARIDKTKKEQDFALQEFDIAQKNEANEFSWIRHSEAEKTKFQQDAAKKRIDFQIEQLEILKQLYIELASATGKNFDDQIRAITISIDNLKASYGGLISLGDEGGGNFLAKLLGMTPEDIETMNAAVSAFDQATDMILDTLAKRYAAEAQYYANIAQARENDLQSAQTALNAEIELAKLGYANNVDMAKNQVAAMKTQRDKALADQEAAQRKQQTIESLQQASSLITAVANIFSNYSTIPYVGELLAVLAAGVLIAEFATLKTQAKAASATLEKGGSGVVRGKRHSSGGEDFDDHIEVEDGERWSVYNRKATNKYGSAIPELTSALNQGRPLDAIAALSRFVPAQMNQIPLKEINEAKRNRINEYAVMEGRLGNIEGEVAELNGYFRNKEEIIEQGTNFTKYRKGNSIKIVRRNG